jgi:hypothetical protein
LYISIYVVKGGTEEIIAESILRDIYYHKFIFDDIDDTKIEERKKTILDTINAETYWNIRYSMVRKLESIKEKFKV